MFEERSFLTEWKYTDKRLNNLRNTMELKFFDFTYFCATPDIFLRGIDCQPYDTQECTL